MGPLCIGRSPAHQRLAERTPQNRSVTAHPSVAPTKRFYAVESPEGAPRGYIIAAAFQVLADGSLHDAEGTLEQSLKLPAVETSGGLRRTASAQALPGDRHSTPAYRPSSARTRNCRARGVLKARGRGVSRRLAPLARRQRTPVVIRPILFPLRSTNHIAPSGPAAMAYAPDLSVGIGKDVMRPSVVVRPIAL
jgi:hypothetical protein